MSGCCPCCGGELDSKRLIVDLNTNSAIYSGQSVFLGTPKTAEMVFALAMEWPKAVSFAAMSQALWGAHEPERPCENIRTYASFARKALAPLNILVEVVWGRACYRLVLPSQPQ